MGKGLDFILIVIGFGLIFYPVFPILEISFLENAWVQLIGFVLSMIGIFSLARRPINYLPR